MHDASALLQYRPDSVVEDVDDRSHPAPARTRVPTTPPPIARGRVATGDLTVIVQLLDNVDGTKDGWHRLAPNGYETACGIEFGMREEVDRRVYREPEHPLNVNCECWTRKEREKADDAYLKRFGVHYTPRKRKSP
jgi:hypothetical protein